MTCGLNNGFTNQWEEPYTGVEQVLSVKWFAWELNISLTQNAGGFK